MNQSYSKQIIQNKGVYHKYFIEKKIESGLVLLGWEVKAIRSKQVVIDNSYISFQNQEAFIYNSFFKKINTNNNPIYDTNRIRKLLLKKQELLFLKEKIKRYKYTIVIINLFWKNSWIKATIGLAKGKRNFDKRNIVHSNEWKSKKQNLVKYRQ
ncbi:ssrA-binding protein [Candidatus Blochmanniella vafra str. BVAF]|uniref:SsrA-binding protein n=1 Tax=Blochmanniella vafra (strain BVAF) TaxID=859654 RepID=E8Q6G3_BLOVB|nr:SsrA-binding protein SmpB [Candidatus Blochmannia vafer]ADV33932.1 ssrA-binding protein [Candidatus Blochmannia vafer str. BVAF]